MISNISGMPRGSSPARSVYFTGHKGLYTRSKATEESILNSLPAHGRGKAMPTTSLLHNTVPLASREGLY